MTRDKIPMEYQDKIIYNKNHWDTLIQKRNRARKILQMFYKEGLKPLVFGSVARGDVKKDSDIDIIFPDKISTYKLEVIIDKNREYIFAKDIIQATPGDTIKANIYLSEQECLTVPLTRVIKSFFNSINLAVVLI